jgi:glutaminyl-tRNA synthetase
LNAEGGIAALLHPDSLELLDDARLEPALADFGIGDAFQLERLGYFCVDPDANPDRLVINRTTTLRDTWAKVVKQAPPKPKNPNKKNKKKKKKD